MSVTRNKEPTAEHFAHSVVQRLQDAGHVAVYAGGCVRDMILAEIQASETGQAEARPDDFDVATDATPNRVREIFGKRNTLAVGESFGVIIVLGPKVNGLHLQVEVATFRTEGTYSDGRRPDSVVFCTPEEDAARRDFTINGMFYDPIAEQVLDFVDGERDLRAGVIRAIGDPHARIAEDKLRMLRAVRFTARFGFALDAVTLAAVKKHADEIVVVSWERITQELRKILTHRSRVDGLKLLAETGLLQNILPEFDEDRLPAVGGVLSRLASSEFTTALACLLQPLLAGQLRKPVDGTVSQIGRRMKLSNDDRAAVHWLVANRETITEFEQLDLADRKVLLSHDNASELLKLAAADEEDRLVSASREAIDFLASTSEGQLNPPPLISGGELQALGLKPGKQFKELLELCRRAQLNEQINTLEEALALVQSEIGRGSDNSSAEQKD